MKQAIKDTIILIFIIAIIGGSLIVLLYNVQDYPSSKLKDWADLATYLSVGISLISIAFIYLTYRNQVIMSSALQFESTFFQWYQIHTDLLKDLKPLISESVNNIILPELRKDEFENLKVFEQLAQNDIDRPLHRYYRSMYHLFKYIKLSPILSSYLQRKKYYDIIQSNMSDDELIMFLCFVLGDKNRDKKIFRNGIFKISFKDLIDKGHILKNCYVPDSSLLKKMTPIVINSFPNTKNSFHFFKVDEPKENLTSQIRKKIQNLKNLFFI